MECKPVYHLGLWELLQKIHYFANFSIFLPLLFGNCLQTIVKFPHFVINNLHLLSIFHALL